MFIGKQTHESWCQSSLLCTENRGYFELGMNSEKRFYSEFGLTTYYISGRYCVSMLGLSKTEAKCLVPIFSALDLTLTSDADPIETILLICIPWPTKPR